MESAYWSYSGAQTDRSTILTSASLLQWYGKGNLTNWAVAFKLPRGDTSPFWSCLSDQKQSSGHAHIQWRLESPGKENHHIYEQIVADVELTWISSVSFLPFCTVSSLQPQLYLLMLFSSCLTKGIIFLPIDTNFWNWFLLARYGPCAYPWIFERTRKSGIGPTWIILGETDWEAQLIRVKSRQNRCYGKARQHRRYS